MVVVLVLPHFLDGVGIGLENTALGDHSDELWLILGADHRPAFSDKILYLFHRQKNRSHIGQGDLFRLGQAA